MQVEGQRTRDKPHRRGTAAIARGNTSATPPSALRMLSLQRDLGNAAVVRMLQRQAVAAPPVSAAPPVVGGGPTGDDFESRAARAEQAIADLKTAEAEVTRLKADKAATRLEKKHAAAAYKTASTAHHAAVVSLAGWTRENLPDKGLIDGFLDRQDLPASDKVRVIGLLAASTARMEFLLGTMYHEGVKAKWEKDNTGVFPDVYDKAVGGGAQPWCTKFAGYAYTRLGFQADAGGKDTSMFQSGYRLRHWSKTGKNVDNSKQLTPAGKTVAASGSGGVLIDSDAWKQLVKNLKKAKVGDRPGVTAEFFKTRPVPQPGDVVVKPRGSEATNEFTGGGKSHTMMVDQFDRTTWQISTVEGNAGDRVGARVIDLTDPAAVGQIIFLTRLGTEYFGDPKTSEPAAEPGFFGAIATAVRHVLYSEEMLLVGPNAVIARLVAIDSAQKWIASSKVDASVHDWIAGGGKAPGKEE